MNDKEKVELIATKLMGWTPMVCIVAGCDASHGWELSGDYMADSAWNPLISAADSKMVRDKLRERFNHGGMDWDNTANPDTPFLFMVFNSTRPTDHVFQAYAADEFLAVVECAVRVLTA